MLPNKNKRKIKIQNSMEYIIILVVVAMIALGIGVYYINSTHNVSVGTSDEIISAQASSSNTLLLKLSELLPSGAQIKGINFTGVPSGTPISVSLESQTPVYVNGYPEYSFSVSGLSNPLTYYNVSDLVYEVNGKTIAVPTITGEPMAIEETSLYSNSNTNSFPKPTSIPSGIVAYVPITITNTQDISTSKPFQQMIQIQESQFSNYITYNGNIANFEFFTQRGQVLPAWIESNTSGNLIIWVKIFGGIPAKPSQTIYLGFASTTTNLLSSSGTSGIGEAPQLSSTYGEYDNGASVFNNYWNFAGTTCPSGWTCSGVTINNGISIPSYSYAYTTSDFGYNTDTIVDFYGNFPPATTNHNAAFGFVEAGTGNAGVDVGWSLNANNNQGGTTNAIGQTGLNENPGGYTTGIPGGVNTTGYHVYSIYYTPSFANFSYDYGTPTEFTTTLPTSAYPLGGINDQSIGQSTPGPFYWLRVRAYPPNGVMPSVSFGTIQ